MQGRSTGEVAEKTNPVFAQVSKATEDFLVSPIRCPSKKQEAREQLRSVARGVQGAAAGVGNFIGSGIKGVGDSLNHVLASLQRTAASGRA
jgi:hypothetical protein